MPIILKTIFLIVSISFLIIGIFSCIQENLKQLLLYTIIGHLGYFNILLYNVIQSNTMSQELLSISLFYLLYLTNLITGFFYTTFSMKRSGNTYQIKSIYDLAQIWLINKTTTSCLILLLLGLSGLPLFPGFICKWFFVEEIFQFNKLLGLLSFFMCLFSTYPYIRIINQMCLNTTLILNKKGPRWYFDNLLNPYKKTILIITTFIYILITSKPSIIWFTIDHISTYITY